MKDWKNETLIDALSYCALRELPEKDNEEDFWLRAVALVQKTDGTQSYVYVEKSVKDLSNRIMKDWGTSATICNIIEYYPFSFLKAQFMPKFKTQKKEERIKYLTTYDKRDGDWQGYSLKELDAEVLKRAARKQLEQEKRSE